MRIKSAISNLSLERVIKLGMLSGTRITGAAFQFGSQVVIARVAGAPGLGVYLLYVAWVRLGSNVAALGYPNLLLRKVSVLADQTDTPGPRAVVARSLRRVLAVTIGFLLIWALLVGAGLDALNTPIVPASIVSSGFLAVILCCSAALKGVDQAQKALAQEFSLLPVGLLVVIGGLGLADKNVTPIGVVWISTTLHILVAGWGWVSWLIASREVRPLPLSTPVSVTRSGLSSQAQMAAANVLNVSLWTIPIVVMPWFLSPHSVGLFGAAQRLVALPTFVLVGIAGYFSPRFARTYAAGDKDGLLANLKASQLFATFSFVPFLLAYVVAPTSVLGLFGKEFEAASAVLVILTLGQCINSLTGLSADLLYMAGREKWELGNLAFCSVLVLVSTIVLIDRYSIVGAAISFAGTMAVRNVISYWLARRISFN